MSANPPFVDANGFFVFGDGSNLRSGTNPPYGVSDLLSFYPQFGNDSEGNPIISTTMIQAFIDMANNCIQQARWRSAWQIAMGLFVAHFCTLYLQSQADPNSGAAAVMEAGRARGVITSESVGDVSVSTENLSDLDGWAAWNLTVYGQQLATMARLVGKGGIYIY
ncbi:MAG: DUF4054 domain-containing protein [Alicyclobacillus sp.]|nr:DUF4054 domain-containing protein [Alicyclobacillus sp.]